jgi:hypothetical protein
MLSEIRTGLIASSNGAVNPSRSDKTGATVVAQGHGELTEPGTQGKLFVAFLSQGTSTVAAGNIAGASAAASTQFAIWNPVGSTVNLCILKLRIQQYSGTPTAGGLTLSTFSATGVANSLATAGAVHSMYIGGAPGFGLCLASAAGAALTGGSALTTLMNTGWSSSATALASPAGIGYTEELQGGIVIPPGYGLVPTWAGAGTTYLVGYSLLWEEVAF